MRTPSFLADHLREFLRRKRIATLAELKQALGTRAPTIWNTSTGTGVSVAVLDTGISQHDDLSITGGTSVVSDDSNDENGHGTAVAGVLAAIQNDQGIIGISPGIDLFAVKIMNQSTGSLSDAIAGINWAVEHNTSIILMSWGTEDYSEILKEALQDAHDQGILLIAAGGNNGPVNYPAAYDTVISVGSINENDQSVGSTGPEQELVAPGTNITTTSNNNGYIVVSGSSVAAPHAAGAAALQWAANHSLTNDDVRAILRNTAQDLGPTGKDDEYGYGLVQATLDTTNTTLQPGSYFYEVFNITDYGQPNQTITFWTNGTGTIDDLTLAPTHHARHLPRHHPDGKNPPQCPHSSDQREHPGRPRIVARDRAHQPGRMDLPERKRQQATRARELLAQQHQAKPHRLRTKWSLVESQRSRLMVG